MDNKAVIWENIRIAIVVFICVFGMVTCHGIDQYRSVRILEAETDKAKAEADAAKARLELERLKQTNR